MKNTGKKRGKNPLSPVWAFELLCLKKSHEQNYELLENGEKERDLWVSQEILGTGN